MAAARGLVRAVALTPAHKRFLVRDALLIAAVANGALSALIAWLFTFSEDEVPQAKAPLVGGPSVLVDTVATCFVLPFLTTLVITTVVWKEMRTGHLTQMDLRARLDRGAAAEDAPAQGDLDRADLPASSSARSRRSACCCSTTATSRSASSCSTRRSSGSCSAPIVTPWIAMVAFGDDPPPEEVTPETPPAATTLLSALEQRPASTVRARPRPRRARAPARSGARSRRRGSNRCAWRIGLSTRFGRGVVAGAGDPLPVARVVRDLAVHEQVPEVRGAGAPVDAEVLGQEDAVISRARLCIQPSRRSWRMPASTIGYPVRPCFHASRASSSERQPRPASR